MMNHDPDPEALYDQYIKTYESFAELWRHPPASDAFLECVIVEPRPHPRLYSVIANISCHLPYAAITVLHSQKYPLPTAIQSAKNIKKIVVCEENLTRPEYSELLTSPKLWDEILESPYVLVFQTDTGIRENQILRFMEFDYVGAPWSWMIAGSNHIHVGNGGFSLRSRHMMSQIVNKFRPDPNWKDPVTYEQGEAEDIFFARHLVHWDHARLPSVEIASAFSVEHNYHRNPMGFHRAYSFHPLRDVYQWLHAPSPNTKDPMPKIQDVWIQTATGTVYTTHILKQWLSLGISGVTRTLHIPIDSQVPILPHQIQPQDMGVAKYLCFTMCHNSQKIYQIPLYQLRVKDQCTLNGKDA